MFCPNCGNDVGASNFCSGCGTSVSNGSNYTVPTSKKIILKRPTAYGGAYKFNVLVDDCLVNTLSAKQTLSITVDSQNSHTVQIDSNGHGSSYPIAIPAGSEDLAFDVKYSVREGIALTQTSGPKAGPTSTKSGGCYVATAVYGSYDCPEVWTLRRYRDYSLALTWYGRLFIALYYAISPTIVKWFGRTRWFNKMWRRRLDHMVEKLHLAGYKATPYQDKIWK